MALRHHLDAIQTIFATLAGTNTAKIVDLLEGMFGVDIPTICDKEVESITNEEEKHLPEMGTTSNVAAQSADIAKFTQPFDGSSTMLK